MWNAVSMNNIIMYVSLQHKIIHNVQRTKILQNIIMFTRFMLQRYLIPQNNTAPPFWVESIFATNSDFQIPYLCNQMVVIFRIFDSIELAKGLGCKEKWLENCEKDLIAFSFSAGLLIFFYFKHFIKNVKHLISLKRSMKVKKLWKNLFYENENTSGYFF